MGDGGQQRNEGGGGAMLLDGHGVVIGVEKASSTSKGDCGVMLRQQGDGGVMPLQPTTAPAANSMRCGSRQREAKVVGGVMPLAAGCGAMPRGEDGGKMLPREGDGVMPFRRYCGVIPLRRCMAARGRHKNRRDASQKWRDAIHDEDDKVLMVDEPALL